MTTRLAPTLQRLAPALLLAAALTGHAAPITGVTTSTSYPFQVEVGTLPSQLSDGSGLSSYSLDAVHEVGTPSNAWAYLEFFGRPISGSITFDLGASYLLDAMAVWNWNAYWPFAVQNLTVEFSLDGLSYAAVAGTPEVLDAVPDLQPNMAEVFALDTTARYVRFNITSSHGGDGFGLSEVMFSGTAVTQQVPEPSTLLLTALALAGLGGMRWRAAGR